MTVYVTCGGLKNAMADMKSICISPVLGLHGPVRGPCRSGGDNDVIEGGLHSGKDEIERVTFCVSYDCLDWKMCGHGTCTRLSLLPISSTCSQPEVKID